MSYMNINILSHTYIITYISIYYIICILSISNIYIYKDYIYMITCIYNYIYVYCIQHYIYIYLPITICIGNIEYTYI